MSQTAMIFSLSVAGGGGALCRYMLGLAVMKRFPTPRIPIAMIIVNIIGSIGLGGLYGNLSPEGAYQDALLMVLGLGFFGAFTTFSTFSVEAIQLIMDKKYQHAIIYIFVSIIGSSLGFLIGYNIM